MLALSSSNTLGGPDGRSVDATSDKPPALLDSLSVLCFCNSFVISSTGNAPMISSRIVGRSANTVYVQSSWFCSNRRRRLEHRQYCSARTSIRDLLLFRYPVLTHTLPCFEPFAPCVLSSKIAQPDGPSSCCQPSPVAPEPAARCLYHRCICEWKYGEGVRCVDPEHKSLLGSVELYLAE